MKFFAVIGAALLAAGAMAGERFAYQGVLQSSSGAATSKQNVAVTFRLYAQAEGGTALWARQVTVRTDAAGKFSVELSDDAATADGNAATLASAFAATLAQGKDLYVGLTVKTGSEIRPRQKILVAPQTSVAKGIRRASSTFDVDGLVTFKGGATFTNKVTVAGRGSFAEKADFKGQTTFQQGITLSRGAVGTMPVGTILFWNRAKSEIPRGWALCDGTTYKRPDGSTYTTPNFINRMPLGAGENNTTGHEVHEWKGRGGEGGASKVTLTIDTMPKHHHIMPHDIHEGDSYKEDPDLSQYIRVQECGDPGNGLDGKRGRMRIYQSSDAGGGQPHNNMPAYYAIYFIIRVF